MWQETQQSPPPPNSHKQNGQTDHQRENPPPSVHGWPKRHKLNWEVSGQPPSSPSQKWLKPALGCPAQGSFAGPASVLGKELLSLAANEWPKDSRRPNQEFPADDSGKCNYA